MLSLRFPIAIWSGYLIAVVIVGAGYLVGPLASGPLFNLMGASSVVALVAGARMHLPPGGRKPWYLLATGQAAFIASDLVSYNHWALLGSTTAFPSPADALYLATYPALAAGLLALIRSRNLARDRASLIDALIVAIAVGTPLWVYLMAPYAQDDSLPLLTRLTSMAYPTMDLLLAATATRLAVGPGARGAAFALLFGGLVALFATDVVYGWLMLHGGYEPGGGLDGGWLMSYAMLGAAALHPSMRRLSERAPEQEGRLTRPRLAVLAVACLLVPGIRAAAVLTGDSVGGFAVPASSAALSLLVLARLAGVVRLQEAAARQLAHLAHHDALTGLPNRTSFHASVERALARADRRNGLVAVLYIDLDDFKAVNDDHGHAAGDAFLADVAARIRSCMRTVDTAARLGGDEFAVVLDGIDARDDALRVAQRITETLGAPGTAPPYRASRASIGIAFGDDAPEAEVGPLLSRADAAMYAAKRKGKGRCRVFDESLRSPRVAG